MARSTPGPGRRLGALLVFIAIVFGLIGAGVIWSSAQWTPKLALDLEGGTQMVLTPVSVEGQRAGVTKTQLDQAVNIIRQRVNGNGVTEAEVTTEGNQKIVVALPGKRDKKTEALVEQAAQLQFRAVLQIAQGFPQPTPSPSPSGSPTATGKAGTATKQPTSTAKPSASATGAKVAKPTASSNNAALPRSVREALAPHAATKPAEPTASPTSKTAASPTKAPAAKGSDAASGSTAKPKDASDTAWIQAEDARLKAAGKPTLSEAFEKLNCADPANLQGGFTADPRYPMVACSDDGSAKYVLGPAEVLGTDVKSADAVVATDNSGNPTGQWQVLLNFTGGGTKKFADVTTRLAAIPQTEVRNQFGIVLDGLVISAPQTNERIPGGQAQITGSFTQETAKTLANQLKFGALPVTFRVETVDHISALLGKEQLERGLLAGLIGLVLVVIYSLAQYRALGFVTVFSLVIAGIITYGLVVLLGWRQGYRLSLPGVAGLIVSIGVTADSFIVYFERVRDEVRDGRPLRMAVETAWARARRTIIISDTVSFLAAVVLYLLAVGGVRGFAFTLGLTTLVDVIVVFLFTHPLVSLLARTEFFGNGHRLSGFDPAHLGRSVSYAGRGRVRPPSAAAAGGTIAERKAAAARGASGAVPTDPSVAPRDGGATDIEQPAGSGRES